MRTNFLLPLALISLGATVAALSLLFLPPPAAAHPRAASPSPAAVSLPSP